LPDAAGSSALSTASTAGPSLVGVLALQGDFAAHGDRLVELGHRVRFLRKAHDLVGIDGIVLPGGESSVMLQMLDYDHMTEPLKTVVAAGLPTLATCAGLILLASEVTQPAQSSLGLIDVSVERNGYGRQVHSGIRRLRGRGSLPDCEGIFIRAPRIVRVGQSVAVLATFESAGSEHVAAVACGNILAASFHPELAETHPLLTRFSTMVESACPLRTRAQATGLENHESQAL